MAEIICSTCVYHFIRFKSLSYTEQDHLCKNTNNAYTTIADREIHESPIYGRARALTFGKCMEKNKNNDCKYYEPTLKQRFINWMDKK